MQVFEADTIDAAAEEILQVLKEKTNTTITSRTVGSRDNVFYFDGWDGLGASTVTTGNSRIAECLMVCRVHSIGHSAKKLFVECIRNYTRQNNDTRHTNIFAEC